MKGDRTTTTLPAGSIPHGSKGATDKAVGATLRRLNGGLPPNLHLAPRPQLLKVIKELHEENKQLKLTEAKR